MSVAQEVSVTRPFVTPQHLILGWALVKVPLRPFVVPPINVLSRMLHAVRAVHIPPMVGTPIHCPAMSAQNWARNIKKRPPWRRILIDLQRAGWI
jgi:hypothetical protein